MEYHNKLIYNHINNIKKEIKNGIYLLIKYDCKMCIMLVDIDYYVSDYSEPDDVDYIMPSGMSYPIFKILYYESCSSILSSTELWDRSDLIRIE